MKRLTTILLAGTAILVSACSTDRSGSRGTVPTDPPPSSESTVDPSGSATTAPPGSTGRSPAVQPTRTTTVAVWFTRGGKIISTSRTRPASMATSRLALTARVAGPSAAEAAAGVGTVVPAGTTFEITISG